MRTLWSLSVFLLGPAPLALGQEGGALATSDAVMVTAVTAIVIGGFILYEYVRGRGMR
ncbi:MAG: hypothetical protein ACE5LQ_00845 [Candidatus Bipolaricaulia bacterium]